MAPLSAPFRVGIIGLGQIAETRHLPVLVNHPRLRVVAACDVDSAPRSPSRGTLSYSRLFPDPQALIHSAQLDLVVILTPPVTHAPLAHAALDANKPVFVEKPLTLSPAEAEETRRPRPSDWRDLDCWL